MADALSFLEEDLTCLICCDIFTDPVTLNCSHSLCDECLQRFWKTQDVCLVSSFLSRSMRKSDLMMASSSNVILGKYQDTNGQTGKMLKKHKSCEKQADLKKNYSDTLKRLQHSSEPNTVPELEEYQHYPIQTVIFTTWARMQNLVEHPPVTLDPETASSKLLVSQDCTSVEYSEMNMTVSDNPERLYVGVLASQGFSSGVHCWDVEVRDNDQWTLGVVGQTVNRKTLYKMDPKSRFWCFRYINGSYKQGNKPLSDIDCIERPNIIRLQLDFDEGELRFIDPFRNICLCTYTGGFPEKVFPYFCTGDEVTPLNVFPANKL
ncbi:hypothetical protein QQF64_034915 [Cirrhinus molitorella]|uniref:Zinc-binding protein A33-like n=1 Tax=Cirrhinus molitorella TaxID=172907 RepID=A0ABR3NEV9_9TELE